MHCRKGESALKYTKNERTEIGRRIYCGELTVAMAADRYGISFYTAREYLRAYKAQMNIAAPTGDPAPRKKKRAGASPSRADFEEMSRDELIDALIRARINEERAKKGYAVKGDGAEKEFILLSRTSSK